ncbi:DUF3631 domain-containing protein [Streptomyces sp. AK02-01A]|uniref:DUF3631 domain-containing protein n=1 Tax=Streptomyces sp. AK02-01A TaxID=3028648 RepID=UPI0029A2C01D|nr:DUF3631 domain-containing protein [Streptomyces sp. AK02-01A]MDX3854914.1 DUF3631 domain-containing protein [Streptomyces sp. AK02-01A]
MVEPVEENPHHRAILDRFLELRDLDRRLLDFAADRGPNELSAAELLDQLTALLVERMAVGHVLTRLMSTDCCCATTRVEQSEKEDDSLSCPGEHPQPASIVHAALSIFGNLGDPEAVASGDLVTGLRQIPGVAEGRWRYRDLTQSRLAQLLAPYEVSTRDVTLPDGRRRKSYRRSTLIAALPDR